MLKAIIFDFDGVIVDTESEWYYIYRDWLKINYDYDLRIEDYLVCVGSHISFFFEFLKKEFDGKVDGYAFEPQAIKQFKERSKNLPPMEGVLEVIREAKAKNLKLAIATSSMREKPVYHLERLGILNEFDVLSTRELSEKVKPEPDIFLKAAELLECNPEECLVIEDSGNGLLAARRANMTCIIVTNQITSHCEFEGYYQKLETLKQLNLNEVIKDYQ